MAKHNRRVKCQECSKMIFPQGMGAHMRKHKNRKVVTIPKMEGIPLEDMGNIEIVDNSSVISHELATIVRGAALVKQMERISKMPLSQVLKLIEEG